MSSENADLGSQEQCEKQILDWLTTHLSGSNKPVRGDIPFSEIGLDSVSLSLLLRELSQQANRVLSPTLAYAYPTPRALAAFLSRPEAVAAPPGRVLSTDASQPIAIVGMACRFPKAADLGAFWQLLVQGIDAVDETPPERWNAQALHSADVLAPGSIRSTRGGFLPHVDRFDPLFFGISPREAAQLDPQQRLMLELAWEGLEDAGLPADALRGSPTGVYVGVMWSEYAQLIVRRGPRAITPHTVMGYFHSFVANRVSYALGLQGPSIALDTVCSSSLVALHLACDSLRRGETSLALVGGVNLCLLPESTMLVSRGGALSPDGRCFTFDARANGCIRGEGAGLVVLKPLLQAQRDGDRIYCVVRGSAVNNDGASNGFSAPNPLAQEAVLTAAYKNAGVAPQSVTYVELHGTGTPLGDPIEAGALARVLCAGRAVDRPLRVGSVKTNLGHTEAAAGIAGLIKGALSLQHRTLPRSLHYQTRNPHIPADWPIQVQDQTTPWPDDDAEDLPTLGVSSFGMGGTNAHVVLQAAQSAPRALVTLAADSEADLRRQVEESSTLRIPPFPSGPHRLAVLFGSARERQQALTAALQNPPQIGTYRGCVTSAEPMVWVFSGQGSQWLGMGRVLLQREPLFRRYLARCDHRVKESFGWSLLDALFATPSASRLGHIEVSWPALVAIEIALSALLRSYGCAPARIVGHSNGEVAAAYAAGILSIDEAVQVACVQGQVMQRVHGQGGMALVALPWSQAHDALGSHRDQVCCAIEASPDSTVLSGSTQALDAVLASLDARGIPCHRIKVDVAGHSPHLRPLHDDLWRGLAGIRPRPGSTPLYSMESGKPEPHTHFDRAYWVSHLSAPVRFARVIAGLVDQGFRHFVEIAPHPIVLHGIQGVLRAAGVSGFTYACSRRGEEEHHSLLRCLSALYVAGLFGQKRSAATATQVSDSSLDSPTPQAEPPLPAAAPTVQAVPATNSPTLMLPISARADVALRDLARAYIDRCAGTSPTALRALVAAASRRRSHHLLRAAVLGEDAASLCDGLSALVQGQPHPSLFQGEASAARAPAVIFLFSGHGGQWRGMGQALLRTQPVFAATVHACAEALHAQTGRDLLDDLSGSGGPDLWERGDHVQPILFSIQVGLAALWRSLGVQPRAVVGTSMGEVAAAYTAGCLTLSDAMRIICERSALLMRLVGKGAMAVISLSRAEAQQICDQSAGELSLAAENGPQTCVVSGDPAAIESLLLRLQDRGVFCRRLAGGNAASHSPQVDALRSDLQHALSGLQARGAEIPFLSTVTAADVGSQVPDAAYWFRNMREPVQLWSTLEPLFRGDAPIVLEVSPHPVLLPALSEGLRQRGQHALLLPSLRRNAPEDRCLTETLAQLYCQGIPVRFDALPSLDGPVDPPGDPEETAAHVAPVDPRALPTYPFVRERCWLDDEEPAATAQATRAIERTASANEQAPHPLLGRPFFVVTQPENRFFSATLSLQEEAAQDAPRGLAYLRDHQLEGLPIFPASGYLEIALAVAQQRTPQSLLCVHDAQFLQPLFLPDRDRINLQTVAVPDSSEPARAQIQIASRSGDAWRTHARATIGGPCESDTPPVSARDDWPAPATLRARLSPRSRDAFYAQVATWGGTYGPAFQGVKDVWATDWEVLARIEHTIEEGSREGATDPRYVVHPAWLDACLHAVLAMDGIAAAADPWLPVSLQRLHVHIQPPPVVFVHARGRMDAQGLLVDLRVQDEHGTTVMEVHGLRLARLAASASASAVACADAGVAGILPWLFQRHWQEQPVPAATFSSGAECLAFVLPDDRGGRILAALRDGMARVTAVFPGRSLHRRSDGGYEIDAHDVHSHRLLLREAFSSRAASCHIVFAWGLDPAPSAAVQPDAAQPDAALARRLEWSLRSLLCAVQATIQVSAAGDGSTTPRFTLLTADAQPVATSDGISGVAQAPLWGLLQVAAQEHPQLMPLRVDLSADDSADERLALLREIVQPRTLASDLQVGLRHATRYVCRLQRAVLPATSLSHTLHCRTDACYVVSGGRSGLGLALAQHLVLRGARCLILLARRPPDKAVQHAIDRMQAQGATVHCLQADIASPHELAAARLTLPPTLPPIAGIVHAAAVLEDGIVADLSWDRCQRVLAPKVRGALQLLSWCSDAPLDFFLLCSSVASLVGSPGQASYVCANAFLDALSHQLRRRGVPALSINLGLLADSAISQARPDVAERLHAQGLDVLDQARVVSAIEALLGTQEAQLGLLRLHPARFFAAFPQLQTDAYFQALVPTAAARPASASTAHAGSDATVAPSGLFASLTGVDAEAARRQLGDGLRRLLSQMLRIPLARIEGRTPLVRLGMDSLLAVQLRNRVALELSIHLPLGSLMQDTCIETLVDALLAQRAVQGAQAESADELTEGEV